MVSIITYRDERKLFAVIGAVIVAALVALLQLDFARAGRTSPLTVTVTTITAYAQLAFATVVNGTRTGWTTVVRTPSLAAENGRLRDANAALRVQNDELQERLARVPAAVALERAQLAHPDGLAATVIGYDPEATTRVVTIDRGAKDGVRRDDGVITGEGVVGRIVEVDPLSSKVLLISDATSKLPAVVQKGRWWAIAVGTSTRIKLQYVSQDAKLHVGDRVVTGEGRSFHAGILIGRIRQIDPIAAGALDQSAVVQPAADLSALSRVLVLSHQLPQR
ncbi:MAG TPA: rod shape-determining protein MreC [Candidatus Limnocylindria bacterium]|nr:rod shape-determining protein MreC [Candidatus Limnocylindria bacterium]